MENNSVKSKANEKLEAAKINKEKEAKTKKQKSKKKKIVIVALILAGATLIGSLAAGIAKLFKKDNNKDDLNKQQESIVLYEEEIGLDDLGIEEELSKEETEEKEYGEVTGNINKDEIVEKDNILWKDEEAANKSDSVGKVTFDDQNGTLKKDESGDIVEKEEHFEVKDENGNQISTGSNETGIPDGYAWDSIIQDYVKVEDVGKYVYADATYYNTYGEIVIQKGDIVLKTFLENAKTDTNITTIKPEVKPEVKPETQPETSKPENSTDGVVDSYGGVINKDGTYTIYEVTYMDKATFEAFILDENSQENFGFYNNIIYPISVIEEMVQSKTK